MTSLKATALVGLMATISLADAATATTIRVPDDQTTIQTAIEVALPGDTVLVRCGSYLEHNITMRAGIVLRSETGDPGCATVDAQRLGSVLCCPPGIGPDTRIEGLTLTQGEGWVGGMRCESASPTITNCAFVSNWGTTATVGVGGVSLVDSRASLTNCLFFHNAGGRIGANALAVSNCPSLTLRNCTFLDNSGGGSALDISHCPSLTLINCTLVGNSGGGTTLVVGGGSSVDLLNCIIAFGGDEPVTCWESTVTLRCCDVYGNADGDWVGCIADQGGRNGNLSMDPQFCNAHGGDLTLSASSPCAPEHSPPGCGLIGALPVGCAPQEVESATWGRLKANFR